MKWHSCLKSHRNEEQRKGQYVVRCNWGTAKAIFWGKLVALRIIIDWKQSRCLSSVVRGYNEISAVTRNELLTRVPRWTDHFQHQAKGKKPNPGLHIVLFLFFFFYNFEKKFFIFWLRWVFVAAHGLFSLVVVSRGYSSLRCAGFSLKWLLLLRSTGSRHAGFSSCSTRAQ